MPLLVWVKHNGNVCPQIWHVEQVDGKGQQKDAVLVGDPIKITTEEARLPFSVLLLNYPAPKGEQDADQA